MNEKLTLQYLIEALTKRHQMDPKDADAFVKAFFELIRRALERDKYIKVKGLGTFKRIETDSRGSDEEESEERTGTQGRSRITFTPDVAMRDSINKPFAHFETVILNEHTHFEDMDEEGEEQLPEEEKTGEASDSLLDTEKQEGVGTDESVDSGALAADTGEQDLPGEESVLKEEERLSDESIEQTSPDDASLTEPETPVSEENHEENHLSDVQGTEEEKLPVVDKEESQNADIPRIESSVEADDASQSETHEEPVSQEAEKKEVVPEVVPATEHGSQSLSEIPLDSSDKKIQKEERSKLPWCMYATILLVGVLIGGGIIWALLSGRRYIPEALLRELISEKKVNNAILLPKSTEKKETLDTLAAMETVQADSVGRQKPDSVVKQKPVHVTLPTVSSAAPVVKARAPVKDEKPQDVKRETLADTMEYTITGTMDTYTLQNGESLVKVALKYYGNKKLWPYIVRHNRKVIKNPDNVPVGTVLQIPKLSPKN
ncbi:HU family DNA-binding protein [Phocaeicola barnesiae]|uniref:HU family DNA-binding protein n=1 Tax=Phocaeicola barnesiae TaxID=376804 RepID=UPI001DA9DAA9|nr:HU family DNA-binding protein [Phocaeicola barnesiae]HJG78649.1 HU family DNA-binding protein [Phocaeicola barnesiae]